jgi:hypothetical protein
VFPLFDIAMMQMHWEVMMLMLIEVMKETTAPAPSDDSGDANDGNQLPPGELTSKKREERTVTSKADNMSHDLSDALARYLNGVTAGSEARREGAMRRRSSGRWACRDEVVCIYVIGVNVLAYYETSNNLLLFLLVSLQTHLGLNLRLKKDRSRLGL